MGTHRTVSDGIAQGFGLGCGCLLFVVAIIAGLVVLAVVLGQPPQ